MVSHTISHKYAETVYAYAMAQSGNPSSTGADRVADAPTIRPGFRRVYVGGGVYVYRPARAAERDAIVAEAKAKNESARTAWIADRDGVIR